MSGASPSPRRSEGLRLARLLMVLSSISPLFILWALRGNTLIADRYFIGFCALMVIGPNAFLWWRYRTARKHQDRVLDRRRYELLLVQEQPERYRASSRRKIDG